LYNVITPHGEVLPTTPLQALAEGVERQMDLIAGRLEQTTLVGTATWGRAVIIGWR
jgi:hypothetical protein